MLAAVAILGIWFAVLASVAIQGQRSEGENERRMRASLLADRVLTELELGFAAGEFPDEQGEEFEQDEFVVVVEALPLLELDLSSGGDDGALAGLLESELAGISSDLRAIQVDVTWIEGTAERRVSRLAYAWDPTRFNEAIGNLPEEELPTEDELPEDLPEGFEDELDS